MMAWRGQLAPLAKVSAALVMTLAAALLRTRLAGGKGAAVAAEAAAAAATVAGDERWPRLTIQSRWPEPVLLVRAVGQVREVLDGAPSRPLVRAVLGSGSVEEAWASRRVQREQALSCVASVKPGPEERWLLTYEVRVRPPAQLTPELRLEWRVEYGSKALALRPFPVDSMSSARDDAASGSARFVFAPNPSAGQGAEARAAVWLEQAAPRRAAPRAVLLGDGGACPEWQRARAYHLVVVGDSQTQYMCRVLESGTGRASCVWTKGAMSSDANATAFFASSVQALPVQGPQGGRVVWALNLNGLWEAAYGGSDEAFAAVADRQLRLAAQRSRAPGADVVVVAMTTTAVHPALYAGLPGDAKKWAMTMPRVQRHNDLLRAAVAGVNAELGPPAIELVDMESLSLAAEDDPKEPGDMRHFGSATNEALLGWLLCQLDRIASL